MIAQHRPTIASARPSLRTRAPLGSSSATAERAGQASTAIAGRLENQADLVSAPIKPTAAMLANGAAAGGVSVEIAWRVYRAMLEATDAKTGAESPKP